MRSVGAHNPSVQCERPFLLFSNRSVPAESAQSSKRRCRYQDCPERFPDNLDSDNAFYWIGRSHLELNDLKKAETAFRTVLRYYEHRPTSQGYKTPDVIYMLGKLQEKQNLDQQAAYYCEEVIKRFPCYAAASNAKRDMDR